MKSTPLNDLEMMELLWAAYPERLNEDNDPGGEKALHFAETLDGFEDIADLLGRVVMLTMPTQTAITREFRHALGSVVIHGETASMMAAVTRKVPA